MPEESESPSVGWRAVYGEMEVSTSAEDTVSDERFPSSTRAVRMRVTGKSDTRVPVVDDEK